MPINLKGIQRGNLSVPDPLDILGLDEDGCKGRRLLWVGITGIQGSDTGGSAIPHDLKCGGGYSGAALVCDRVQDSNEEQ